METQIVEAELFEQMKMCLCCLNPVNRRGLPFAHEDCRCPAVSCPACGKCRKHCECLELLREVETRVSKISIKTHNGIDSEDLVFIGNSLDDMLPEAGKVRTISFEIERMFSHREETIRVMWKVDSEAVLYHWENLKDFLADTLKRAAADLYREQKGGWVNKLKTETI